MCTGPSNKHAGEAFQDQLEPIGNPRELEASRNESTADLQRLGLEVHKYQSHDLPLGLLICKACQYALEPNVPYIWKHLKQHISSSCLSEKTISRALLARFNLASFSGFKAAFPPRSGIPIPFIPGIKTKPGWFIHQSKAIYCSPATVRREAQVCE